jgi:ABC-type nitrate/sulfonate/bicarbonate transport system ATPase subunit
MSDSVLVVEGASRSFGAVEAIRRLDLTIRRGEFVAIVGPSGCGKSTLLNLLSGFDKPTTGSVHRHGDVRMVYQQDGLFPWLTVRQNIAMGLPATLSVAQRASKLEELISSIQLTGFADHYPHQLSGGMKQRVELARALAGDVDIMLMDEPFSALDYITRLKMRQELIRLLEQRPRTVVLVTHDIEEAAQLADRVVVLSERPATICSEIAVDLQQPRSLTHPAIVSVVHRVLAVMGLEQDDTTVSAPSR